MTEAPRITYSSRPDANPEAELDALVNAYAYLIEAHAKKTATQTPEPADRGDTAIVTKEGGNSVERDAATMQPRNDATKESKK